MSDLDRSQEPAPTPAMPEPSPVFQVNSADHVWTGNVFKQQYVFLWISVAFLLGSILAWPGPKVEARMGLMQGVLCLFSIGAVWASIVGLRGRRVLIGPVFMLEIIALIAICVFYGHQKGLNRVDRKQALDGINAQIRQANASGDVDGATNLRNVVFKEAQGTFDWGVTDLVMGPLRSARGAPVKGEDEDKADFRERELTFARHSVAWNRFGAGFYMTALAMIFFAVFFAVSIFGAVKSSKQQKEDPKDARRRARDDRRGGAKSDGKKPSDKDKSKNKDKGEITDAKKDGGDPKKEDGLKF